VLGTGGPSPTGMRSFIDRVGHQHGIVVHSYARAQWFDEEAIRWASRGIEAGDAKDWKELGLTPEEAEPLSRDGLSPLRAARAWWEAGIPFGEVAAWIGAGLTPEEAACQRAKGIDAERAQVLRALRDPEDEKGS